MSRVMSFRDLQLIPELSAYTEIELLYIERDALVNKYLAQLGFNVNKPVLYVPNKHRDIQGGVGIGYRAVGEISNDRVFLNSRLCSTIERLLAASVEDISLTKELSKLMGNSAIFRSDRMDGEDEEFPDCLIEPDYEQVKAEILNLEMVRDEIRGDKYNEYGNLKTAREYAGLPA